jgi:hypothetical protein
MTAASWRDSYAAGKEKVMSLSVSVVPDAAADGWAQASIRTNAHREPAIWVILKW